MTRAAQKSRERAALHLLIERRVIDVAVAEIRPSESPDFIMVLADGTAVGVEVVELVDRDLAAGGAGCERFERELREALIAENLRLFVWPQAREGAVAWLNDRDVMRAHVTGVLALARKHHRDGRPLTTYRAPRPREVGAPGFTTITIIPDAAPDVSVGQRAVTLGLAPQVPSLIDAKNAKLPVYRDAVGGPVWLVLLAGARFASGMWSETVRNRKSRSDFDRTFYVGLDEGVAFEVTSVRDAEEWGWRSLPHIGKELRKRTPMDARSKDA